MYACTLNTHTYTYLGQNRTTKRGKPAAFCAVWVIIAACAPLQKYHYMQMRKWKKLYANVSAGNCMQIRVCVLVVGKREYAKQTTELTTIIRGVTSLRSGLKSIRVKGPWTHGALMKSQNRNVDDTNINFKVAHNISGGMAEAIFRNASQKLILYLPDNDQLTTSSDHTDFANLVPMFVAVRTSTCDVCC